MQPPLGLRAPRDKKAFLALPRGIFRDLQAERSLVQAANRLSSPSRFEGRFDVLSVRNRGLGNATSVSAPVADYRVAHVDTSWHLL